MTHKQEQKLMYLAANRGRLDTTAGRIIQIQDLEEAVKNANSLDQLRSILATTLAVMRAAAESEYVG